MATVAQITKKIRSIENKIYKLQREREVESNKLIVAGFKDLFIKHKDLISFRWSQYTPYWNDGDECTFGVYNDDLFINDDEESSNQYELKSLLDKIKSTRSKNAAIKKIEAEIESDKKKGYGTSWKEEQIKEIKNADYDTVKSRLEMLKDIQDILFSMPDESYRDIFGDHVTITVTKDGWTKESCSHD